MGIFSNKAHNVSDVLPYLELYEDGTVLTKDLGLMKCWKVEYKDVTLSNIDADDTAETIARSFHRKTENQKELQVAYWFVTERIPLQMVFSTSSTGEENMVKADKEIEEHRQEIFSDPKKNLLNLYYCCCKVEINFSEYGISDSSRRRADEYYTDFETTLRTIGATITPLSCSAEKSEDNILSFLKYSCGTEQRSYRCPVEGMKNVSAFISSKSIDKGKPMQLGNEYVQMLTLNDFPNETYSGMLASLLTLPFPFKWTTRWIPYTNKESQEKASRLRNKFRSNQKSWKSAMYEVSTGKESQNINTQAVTDTNAVEGVLEDLSQGETLGLMTSTIELIDEFVPELKKKTARVHERLSSYGFDAIEESVLSNFDAWLSSLPGDTQSGRRRALVTASNISCIVPFTSVYHGSPVNNYLKRLTGNGFPMMIGKLPTQEAFYLNLNGRDDDIGHTFIVGSTGGGKSVLLALMASQWARYPKARVILFDRDMSFKNITERSDGAIYVPGADDSPLRFMPLARIKTKPEEAIEWLEIAVESCNVPVTPSMSKAFMKIAEDWDDAIPTVSRFLSRLRGYDPDSPAIPALEKYTGTGPLATLFGGETDSFGKDAFPQKTMIEMGALMSLGKAAVYPSLQFIFSRLDELFDLDPQPTLLMLDEAWVFLGHPVFRIKIKEWLKTLRKKRVFVILAVQNLQDIDNPEEFLTSCYTRIYLANPEIKGEGAIAVKNLYRAIGLTEGEIEVIGNATRKSSYFIQQQGGSALVDFCVDSYQLERLSKDGH